MTTGLLLCEKNGSLIAVMLEPKLSCEVVETLLRLLSRLLRAWLLPRPPNAYLPYPSWPVPAAGPFLIPFFFSAGGASAAAVLSRLPNKPKRCFVAELAVDGDGVRSPEPGVVTADFGSGS